MKQIRSLCILCIGLGAGASVFAQELEVSALVLPALSYSEERGLKDEVDFGLGFISPRSEKWATEFTISKFDRLIGYERSVIDNTGLTRQFVPVDETTSIPITGMLLYRFNSLGRWQPYLGGGLTYTFTQAESSNGHSLDPTISGGADLKLTDRLNWKVDLKQLIGLADISSGHASRRETTLATGLSFKF